MKPHNDRTGLKQWSLAWLLAVAVIMGACPANHKQADRGQPHQHHAAGAPSRAQSAAVSINKTPPPRPAPDGMVWIPGGTFWMGCDDCEMPDATPAHLVTVDGFWMDRTLVTNAEFAQFVQATSYATIAERQPDPKDFPGALPENLVAGWCWPTAYRGSLDPQPPSTLRGW